MYINVKKKKKKKENKINKSCLPIIERKCTCFLNQSRRDDIYLSRFTTSLKTTLKISMFRLFSINVIFLTKTGNLVMLYIYEQYNLQLIILLAKLNIIYSATQNFIKVIMEQLASRQFTYTQNYQLFVIYA